MTSRPARKVSVEELQKVHNLIKQCLKYYLTLTQVVDILHQQHKIEPTFTKTVWKQLEEENQEFFEGYYLRMRLKQQIINYNSLLNKQAALMCQVGPSRPTFQPMPNGYNMPTMRHNTSCYVPENINNFIQSENTQHHVKTSLLNGFNTRWPLMHSGADMSTHYSPDMALAPNSNLGVNGPAIKHEPGYLDDSRYVYGPGGNPIGGALGFLDDGSFEQFGLISQSNGFPELAGGFTNGENKRLDATSENLDLQDFGVHIYPEVSSMANNDITLAGKQQ